MLYCDSCGSPLPAGAVVCPNCGSYCQNMVNYSAQRNSSAPLVFGILAICFCWFGVTSFLGIIFGAMARSKARQTTYGGMSGKVRTGHILGTIGLIAGIVLTAIFVISFIVGFLSAL